MTREPGRIGRGTASSHNDAPPPPYSETDVFSSVGAPTPLSPLSAAGARPNSHADNHSSAGRSVSSSGEPIYTPPLTPQSSHQQSFGGLPSASHVLSPAVAAYFDSRPPPAEGTTQGPHLHHTIRVKPDSGPNDFEFPQTLASRDVTTDDWHTFLNYLLPNHAVQSNSTIIDRKLRAEGFKSDDDGSSTRNPNNNNNARSATSGRVHVEAQLDAIRTSVPVETPDTAAQRDHVEQTVREWNVGFFGPRGITVYAQTGPEDCSVPGAWDRAFYQSVDAATHGQNDRPAGSWQDYSGYPPQHPPFVFDERAADQQRGRGLRFGSLHVGENGISYGENVVIDSNQLRIGGLHVDTNGIRLNGRSIFQGVPGMDGSCPLSRTSAAPPIPGHPFGHPPMMYHGPPPPPPPPPPPLGPGMGPFSRSMPHIPGGFHEPIPLPPQHNEADDTADRGRDPEKAHGSRSRSSSASSVSSVSSSSSGSTVSSVESLPAYDEIADAQLPVARDLLQRWLDHPEQPITKESARALKQQIKASGRDPQLPTMSPAEKAALRREIKDLSKQFKILKKAQRQQARQMRRERKQQRRGEKRERRQVKKELRKAKKNLRKETREAAKEMKRASRDRAGEAPASAAAAAGPPLFAGPSRQQEQQQQQQQQWQQGQEQWRQQQQQQQQQQQWQQQHQHEHQQRQQQWQQEQQQWQQQQHQQQQQQRGEARSGDLPHVPGSFPFDDPSGQGGAGVCGGWGGWGGRGRRGGFGGFRGFGGPGPHHHHGFGHGMLGGLGHHQHHGFGGRGGRGPGRSFSFGGRGGGFGGGENQRTPGSWPAEGEAPNDPHAVSRAKHRDADQLETQIAQLAARISELGAEAKSTGSASHPDAARHVEPGVGTAGEEGSGDKKKLQEEESRKQQEEAMTLQTEITMLEELVAQIRLEADGDFAKELAQEEQRNWNMA